MTPAPETRRPEPLVDTSRDLQTDALAKKLAMAYHLEQRRAAGWRVREQLNTGVHFWGLLDSCNLASIQLSQNTE